MSKPIPQKALSLIPILGSDKDGEVVATARALVRVLKANDLDFHDVVAALSTAGEQAESMPASKWMDVKDSSFYHPLREQIELVWDLICCSELSEWELEFTKSVYDRLTEHNRPLSEKQAKKIDQIGCKIYGAPAHDQSAA